VVGRSKLTRTGVFRWWSSGKHWASFVELGRRSTTPVTHLSPADGTPMYETYTNAGAKPLLSPTS
jgi:hypothetical protein